jgi:hypothetical protein
MKLLIEDADLHIVFLREPSLQFGKGRIGLLSNKAWLQEQVLEPRETYN